MNKIDHEKTCRVAKQRNENFVLYRFLVEKSVQDGGPITYFLNIPNLAVFRLKKWYF